MRRQFQLPAEDEEYLNSLGLGWETVMEGTCPWILIHGFHVPPGYAHQTAIVAIRVLGYPPGIIDMAYFHPVLARTDGKPIGATSTMQLDGRTFQQWSRHYPWNPAEDTLATHMVRVEAWLGREFTKR